MININNQVMEKVKIMSKLTDRAPEEVVNNVLWDKLRKIEDVPVEFDSDKIWKMLDHDNPDGRDCFDGIRNVNELFSD